MKKKFLSVIILLIFAFLFVVKVKLREDNSAKYTTTPEIKGVILPHHELAKELLNLSFEKIKENLTPDIIVIYGTNHYFPVSETYTTTKEVKDKFNINGVLVNNDRVGKDHSIQTILPYVKQYFPDSIVVPILVSTRYESLSDINRQAENFIKSFKSDKTLYIASVDFAHNVSLIEGLKKNDESIKSISNFDFQETIKYNDDHMDSATAMATFLSTMKNLNAMNWQIWFSSHGALLTGVKDLNGTSYVVGSFSR